MKPSELRSSLRCDVDYVTIFDDVSPQFDNELLPDVLVKGGDYDLDQIHGREEVEAAGGKVISLPFVKGDDDLNRTNEVADNADIN